MANYRLCSVAQCGNVVAHRGWCSAHYQRWKRHGDPEKGRALNGASTEWVDFALAYKGTDCLIWPYSRGSNGYANTSIDGKTVNLARYICEKVYGAPSSPDYEAAHSCGKGDHGCIAQSHLRWATSTENKTDQLAHGTRVRGEQSHLSKITEEAVRQIRAVGRSEPQRQLADRFGISVASVSMIISRKSWSWLE